MLSNRRRLPSPDDDGHDCGLPLRIGLAVREAILTLGRLEVHVRDLDALDDPERSSRPQRGSGVVRVDVGLQRARIADDEQRVAERRQLPLERRCVERVALTTKTAQ